MKTTLWVLLFLCTSVLFAEVLFYDNFNRADGAVGYSWTNIGLATTTIENNAMKIVSPNGTGIKHDFTAITSGVVYIQYDWKVVSTGWYADAFPTGLITHLTMDVDGNLSYDLDGTMISPVTMQNTGLGVYATIRLKIDLDADRFSVWINDVLAAENIAGNAISSFSSFTLRGLGASTVQYVDNFMLTNTIPPYNFTATGHLNNIDLSWNPSPYPEIVTYQVLRDTTSPANIVLVELPGTQTTFTDTTAEPNTDYFYRIRAILGGSIFTDYSVEVTAHLQPQINVLPQNITFNVGYGYSDSTNVTIGNTGNYPLEWSFSGSSLVPTDGLVSYYPFEGSCVDVSNHNTGLVNGATLTADRFGRPNSAYHFDYDDHITCTTNGFPTGNNDRTFMGWYKVDSFGSAEMMFFCYGFFSQNQIIGMNTNASTNTKLRCATVISCVLGTTNLNTSQWYFIGFKNQGNTVYVYLNGVLNASGPIPLDTQTNGNDFIIGTTNYGTTRPFWGSADDLCVYNRALTDAEILNMYNNTSHPHLFVESIYGLTVLGSSADVKIQVDTSKLDCGTYVDTLYVNSNDPENPVVPIVITTNVLPPNPTITPDPLIVNLNVENPTRETQIQLHNQGQGKLVFHLSGTDDLGDPDPMPPINGFTAMGVFNEHRYYRSNNTMAWTSAKALCEQNGGHLATIHSIEENTFIYQNTFGTSWIGLSDEATEGSFLWITNEPLSFTHWQSGQPDNSSGAEDYGCIRYEPFGEYWNDAGIAGSFYAVLEIESLNTGSVLSFNPTDGSIQSSSMLPVLLSVNGTLLPDGIYQTSISVDAEGGSGPFYFPVTVNVDFAPPLAVSGLAIEDAATNDDQIGITWWGNAVADSVVSYKIYRRGADETEWQLKATVPGTQLSYVDSDFGDFVDTYQFYRVRAVDWVGNISAVGDSVMGALNRFLNPENMVIQNINNRDIHLSWDPVTETISGLPGTPTCYVIYKSQYSSPITDFDFLSISFTNEFTHQWALHFQPLNRLFYVVTAYGGDMGRMNALVAQKQEWKYGELESRLRSMGMFEVNK